jgi:hypothetical protein
MKSRETLIFCTVKCKAKKEVREQKATGDDDVHGDVHRLSGEESLKIMIQRFNIYESGQCPKDVTDIAMIALREKPKAIKCRDYCKIDFVAHTARTVERILKRKFDRKIENVRG